MDLATGKAIGKVETQSMTKAVRIRVVAVARVDAAEDMVVAEVKVSASSKSLSGSQAKQPKSWTVPVTEF